MLNPRLLACCLLVGLVAVGGVASAQFNGGSITTVDDAHGVADGEAISQYKSAGTVTGAVEGLNMSITVTDNKQEVVDGLGTGALKTYIYVDYDEEITRTVRFYVPAAMVEPRIKRDVANVRGGLRAEYEPVDGGEYMAVTVYLNGRTEAAFPANNAFGTYIGLSERAYGTVENVTGVSVPQLGSGETKQWQYPPDYALKGVNATYHLPTDPTRKNTGIENMTLQYDDTPNVSQPTWLTIRRCDAGTEPVCVTTRDGQPVLFSASGEAPPIRYKYGEDRISDTKSAWAEVKTAWSGLLDNVGEFLGGLTG